MIIDWEKNRISDRSNGGQSRFWLVLFPLLPSYLRSPTSILTTHLFPTCGHPIMQLEKRESGNSEGAKAQGISLSNMTGHGRPTHPFFVRTRTGPNYPDVLLAYLKNILRVCSIHIFPGENINHHGWRRMISNQYPISLPKNDWNDFVRNSINIWCRVMRRTPVIASRTTRAQPDGPCLWG